MSYIKHTAENLNTMTYNMYNTVCEAITSSLMNAIGVSTPGSHHLIYG